MKIQNKTVSHKCVGDQSPGTVVQFNRQFHQDYPPNDLYIVNDVCSSYEHRTKQGFASQKEGITNLATGKLSFVDPNREVTVMDAEVIVNGPSK